MKKDKNKHNRTINSEFGSRAPQLLNQEQQIDSNLTDDV